jgi:hypothetical protein
MEKKRITTAKTRIKPITSGQFVKGEGYNPSTDGQKLSRVRILATVVDKFNSESGKFAAVTLDDGTDTIRAKVFNAVSMIESVAPGDIIDVFGRIKEYNGEVYIAPEVITRADVSMELLRELEIREQNNMLRQARDLVVQYRRQTTDMSELSRIMRERHDVDEDTTEALMSMQESPAETVRENAKDSVLKIIEKLDTGAGCDYAELLEASGLSEETMDSVINELLSEGSCFEPKPGRIKKL